MGSSRSDSAAKERLKWTQELHDLFEKAVNQLGGPYRATPKGILKAMRKSEITIYHVKSHLQKYRMSKFIPETPSKNKFERRSISEILPNFSATSGAQLNEALQMQMAAQKRMNDQHEVQRNLKVKIEAQGRFLERIAEDYKNCPNIAKRAKFLSPTSLPSLCEESESSAKEFESDFENKTEITSDEKFPAPKRLQMECDNFQQIYSKYASVASDTHLQQCVLTPKRSKISYQSPEISFPWNAAAYCQSPLMPASYGSF
ncbi:hypothetical protein DCAR_0830440 [Daucus carota subsp. sativus]|uniref:HTH myb-type domain-containing protein n=1 Tax=Daucus carota subsp. sativus TaxID=79200 RepID=A0AAF0XMV8_DAUCS|nr:PREDICTED: protein PHR1-LIKE 1-like [Daucus carota subsp. sativus]WOH10963.1 hypothetical protein DCAR_0830440 [Daucus carota subsp. sativus]